MRLRALLLGALVVVLRTASVARADDFRDVARAHYARGVQLAGQSGYAEALQEFNQAYIVSPEFAVLYNIGECHIALGHTVEAIEALSRYLRDGGERVPAPRRQLVRQQLEMLEARRTADPGPPASAAPTPEPTGSAALAAREMARAQVARGDDLAARNQYAAALRAYSDAYATHADFSTLYSIGHCHVALGHPVEAIDAFKKYLLDGGDRVPAGRGDLLGAQIAMLESRLAELTLLVVGPEARVTIDGRDLGRTPVPRAMRMGAGKYRISVTPDVGPTVEREVVLGEAQRLVVTVRLPFLPAGWSDDTAARVRRSAAAAARAAAAAAIANDAAIIERGRGVSSQQGGAGSGQGAGSAAAR